MAAHRSDGSEWPRMNRLSITRRGHGGRQVPTTDRQLPDHTAVGLEWQCSIIWRWLSMYEPLNYTRVLWDLSSMQTHKAHGHTSQPSVWTEDVCSAKRFEMDARLLFFSLFYPASQTDDQFSVINIRLLPLQGLNVFRMSWTIFAIYSGMSST